MSKKKKVPRTRPAAETLAMNLQTLMEARGYTQRDIEALTKPFGKIAQKTVSNILTKRHAIYLEHLDPLSDLFGLTPSELISEDFKLKRA